VQALIGAGADPNLQNKVSERWLLISVEMARGEYASLFHRVCQCTRFVLCRERNHCGDSRVLVPVTPAIVGVRSKWGNLLAYSARWDVWSMCGVRALQAGDCL
jgi:hypothetical protein